MAGYVELIFGSMYSGKTEELMRRLKRCKYVGQKFQLFKPRIDNRYGDDIVTTHDYAELDKTIKILLEPYILDSEMQKNFLDVIYKSISCSFIAEVVDTSNEILEKIATDISVVAIDEVQFFDENIIQVIEELIRMNKRIIVTGLDMYASGKPFGNAIQYLACIAKYVDKMHAICNDCGREAYASYKLDNSDPSIIDVGSNGKYIALCENCYERREKEKLSRT